MPTPNKMQPVGRVYLVEVAHRNGPFFAETDCFTRGKDMSEADGLAALQQQDDAISVWELNPGDGTCRDVSEDMARLWLAEVLADRSASFKASDATTWPQFVGRYITNDEAARWAA